MACAAGLFFLSVEDILKIEIDTYLKTIK